MTNFSGKADGTEVLQRITETSINKISLLQQPTSLNQCRNNHFSTTLRGFGCHNSTNNCFEELWILYTHSGTTNCLFKNDTNGTSRNEIQNLLIGIIVTMKHTSEFRKL